FFFFFQAEDGIRDRNVTGVQTCALPITAFRIESSVSCTISQIIRGKTNNLHLFWDYRIAYDKYENLLYKFALNYRIPHPVTLCHLQILMYLLLAPHFLYLNTVVNGYFRFLDGDFLR